MAEGISDIIPKVVRNRMPSRALRVLFDDSLAANPAGTGAFARGILGALPGLDGIEVVRSGFGSRSLRSVEVARKSPLRRALNALDHLRYFTLELPARARQARCDVIFSPGSLGPLRGGTPAVVTVHDLAALTYPRTQDPWSRAYLRTMLGIQLRRSAALCTVSAAVRSELLERFPGLTSERVHVIPDAPDPELIAATPVAVDGLEQPFLLMVGTIEPRKNQVTALRALARHLAREPASPVRLVIAGSPGWLVEPILREIDQLGIGSRVMMMGRVEAGRLSWLYRRARALLFPSLYEGFGIPVVEAFALGCSVVAARIPAVVEVVGEAPAALLDPLDVDAWASAIAAALRSPAEPARLEAARARAASFSWSGSAQRLKEALLGVVRP
jgi:glycosyltransferase involved in cell wall biosynthesis